MYYVYILKSIKTNKFYAGVTNDLKRRIRFEDKSKAYEFEAYLKSSSGSAFRNKHLL
jgi:predicted GIY-YIG superfamily endonuclease